MSCEGFELYASIISRQGTTNHNKAFSALGIVGGAQNW
jgi:hypothetical protein